MTIDRTIIELIQKLGGPMAEELGKLFSSGIQLIDDSRPFYSGPEGLVKRVGLNDVDYSESDDKKPILVTYGIYMCVAVVGYDEENQVGFLTHIEEGPDPTKRMNNIDKDLTEMLDKYKMDVHIIGGISPHCNYFVQEIIQATSAISSWNIVERDVLGPPLIRSIALDTRDGKIQGYKPQKNI